MNAGDDWLRRNGCFAGIVIFVLLAIVLGGKSGGDGGGDRAALPDADQAAVSPPLSMRRLSSAELAYAVGRQCPTARRSDFKGRSGDLDFYALACTTGDFLVSVNPRGETRVMACSQSSVPCWKPW